MSHLRKYKHRKRENKTEQISFRTTESIAKAFRNYCEDLGFESLSEALNLLISEELRSAGYLEHNAKTESLRMTDERKTYEIHSTHESSLSEKKLKPKPKRTTTKRFTYKPWEIEGRVPCPTCNKWISSTNISRHIKAHGFGSVEEAYTANLETLEKMHQEKLEG